MLQHLPLIVKNSVRNRRRSILTVLSIAASLCLLGVLMALYVVLFQSAPAADSAHRLIVRNKISLANPLPASYVARIKQVPGVKEAMIFQWFGGIYKDNRDTSNFFARFAVEPDKLRTVYPDYNVAEDQYQTFLRERTSCIVGRKLARRLNLSLGAKIQLAGDIFPVNVDLTLRGFYDSEKDQENLFFHYDYLREALPKVRQDRVADFVIFVDRPEEAAQIATQVDDLFRNSTEQTKTETEQAFALSFLSFLGNVKAFLFAICGAVTFTILLVSGNTMAMSVRERNREVGILKTIGYTPGVIMFLLIGEAVFIALLGGAIGLGFAWGLCALFRQMPSMFIDSSMVVLPPSVSALCLAVAAFIGIVSSAIPAWGASNRPILESLKQTD